MPSDSSLKAFLSSLSPEDVATLFAGLRNTLPIGMGVYSPELNAGEAEIVGKRQAEREAARVREMEILTRLLPQAMAKRQAAIPDSGADPFVPTRPRIMRESPFMFTQPRATPVPQQYATGGGVLADQTTPDMSDGGQMIADPQPFAGGGSALKAALSATERDANLRKMLRESKAKTPLYHGTKMQDEYAEQPGQAFTQFASNPTWLAQEPYTASGYAGGVPGSSMYKVYAQVKKPLNLRFDANEEASKAFPTARRLGVDVNHIKGMSNPQWAWEVVNHPSFIDAVEKAGYDAIKMNESGYRTYGVLDPRRIKSATGNRGTFDVTDPDMTKAEGGAVQAFAGGGKAEALKLLKGDLWHGGSYKKGQTITQPLYTTPSRELAESYVEPDRVPGSVLQKLRAEVNRPAPERLVKAASRKFVPENEASGYTPASAFDANLHDPASIAAMIRELRRRGYDSAAASDISMGTGVEAPALVLFPGSKAYQKGGSVFGKKSLDEMQAELLSKEGLSRRALFGLKPDYPLAKTPEPLSKVEQEVKRAEQAARGQGQAPSVTASRVDVDPGTGRKKSIMESVTETPVSRRTVLKTAGSQVAQSMLPMGDLMKLAGAPAVTSPVGAIAQAAKAAPVATPAIGALVAKAVKMGLDEEQTLKYVASQLPSRSVDELTESLYHIDPMIRDPYFALIADRFESNPVASAMRLSAPRGPLDALGMMVSPSASEQGMGLRNVMRQIRKVDPAKYDELKNAARDYIDVGLEP